MSVVKIANKKHSCLIVEFVKHTCCCRGGGHLDCTGSRSRLNLYGETKHLLQNVSFYYRGQNLCSQILFVNESYSMTILITLFMMSHPTLVG